MRRTIFMVSVALVVAAGVMPATTASAGDEPRVRYYEGPTSEGGRVSIGVIVSDEVTRLSLLLIDGPYRCEDGTEGAIDTGVGWGGNGGPVLSDQRLDVSENWHVIAFMVSGRLGSHRGSGTLTFLLPGLTADEQAQVCTMGGLTWTVERIAEEDSASRPAVVQRVGGRTITSAIGMWSERTAVLAEAEDRPIRHYRGRSSLDRGMAARTQQIGTGIELLVLSFGFGLTCEDGSTVEGLYRPPIFGSPTPLVRGRLDLDLSTVGPGEALHVHGELDAHAGEGTLALIWPEITDDLQAQACTTSEQTWEMWRTDAGY